MSDLAARLGPIATRDAPLGARTTYRVGGTASVLVEARTIEDLAAVAEAIDGTTTELLVLGRGSNLLVADGGFDGVVVVLSGDFETIGAPERQPSGTTVVRVGGAVALPVLARRVVDQSLHGFEWAVGVPGSVGGAVRMNAGGHGADVAACLRDAEVFDLRTGARRVRTALELELSYRRSNLAAHDVVTHATFELADGDATEGRRELRAIVAWRRAHQPGGSNAGSVFTNPPDDSAGRLVEAAGAKGLRHGTAQVSDKHANFIQADPDGRADDVFELIGIVRERVARHSGITLATELVTVGFTEAR